jgi:DNA-binding response OmpR family regulator
MAKRILIVDDEPRYLRLLEANLRTEGYEVVTAQDGMQALDVFSANPVDLVLLDVMMPRLDGFGATAAFA